MADIAQYIAQISSAIYGEEVRGSIVSALTALNTAVEAVATTQERTTTDDIVSRFGNSLSRITDNVIFYASKDSFDDVPRDCHGVKRKSGIFTSQQYAANYQIQTYIVDRDKTQDVYMRLVTLGGSGDIYDWALVGEETLRLSSGTGAELISDIYSDASGYLYSVTWKDYIFLIDDTWKDLPFDCRGGVFENIVIGEDKYLQRITSIDGNGYVWTRVVTGHGSSGSETTWAGGPMGKRAIKILVVGDSIAKGVNNGLKGFAGDLAGDYEKKGVRYVAKTVFRNQAVGGATLCGINDDGSNNKMIAKQLINFQAANPNWYPDVIIAGTGTNDYAYNNYAGITLGKIPAAPMMTDLEYNNRMAKDNRTAMDGLECLLYQMAKLYPRAKRVFVTQHKVYWVSDDETKKQYCPTTENGKGYTQTDITDAIIKTCRVYGCTVADVFNDSSLNTAFPWYRSSAKISSNWALTNTVFADHDGDHVSNLGYWEFYAPIVRKAIEYFPAIDDYVPLDVSRTDVLEG